jgi:hypothetical protein
VLTTILSAGDQAKLDELTAIFAAARRGERDQTDVVELVSVDWGGEDGRVYYAATQADDVWPGLKAKLAGARVEARLLGGQFLDVMRDSGTSDDSVLLDFYDGDHAISDLFETYGEGLRLEIFLYFPEVDLLLSQWHGHLRSPDDADEYHFPVRAENGFMSVLLPLPRRAAFNTCQAVYGVMLRTQAEIDEYGMCPVNVHLTEEQRGGAPLVGLLNPDTGLPYPTCPRNTRAACSARIGHSRYYLATDTIVSSYEVKATHGGAIATSRGNENNLKRPFRVFAGEWTVRGLDLLQYVVEVGNSSHPERGSIKLLSAIGEGRLHSATQPKAQGTPIQPQHYSVRLGTAGQASTGFTATVNNYSQTALLNCVLQGDFRNTDPASIPLEIRVQGSDDVREYTSETVFAEVYSRKRAWWLLHLLRQKRYGLGCDVVRFAVEADFIPLAAWDAERITWADEDGNTYTGPRSNGFDAELVDRTAQQQITDLCSAGRYTPPFPYEGKLRVFPLRKLTADELAAAPLFTDSVVFGEPNILRDERSNISTLLRSSVSDAELPNVIKATFYDAAQNYAERPISIDSGRSIEQQLRAGRAFGDSGRRVVEKSIGLLGVTNEGEARRLGTLARDLGEFDEGGIANNQRVRFQTFFTRTLTLYKSKVIRVLSNSLVNRRTGLQQFEYFRVRSVHRLSNLVAEVSAQAYPVDYYETTEAPAPDEVDAWSGTDLTDNPGGLPGARPRPVIFSSVETTRDSIVLEMMRS